MSLQQRVKRLESYARTPHGKGYALYSLAEDDLTGAELVTVPTAEREGLARLADGTKKAVVMHNSGFIFADDTCPDKLLWVSQDGPIFLMPEGMSEADL